VEAALDRLTASLLAADLRLGPLVEDLAVGSTVDTRAELRPVNVD
jgi:hypothetical protein